MALRDSNLYAVSILNALSRNDLSCSLDTLDRIPGEDAEEDERLELLGGIAGELRSLAASGGLDHADVYIRLLHHLAGPATSAGASFLQETPSSDWN